MQYYPFRAFTFDALSELRLLEFANILFAHQSCRCLTTVIPFSTLWAYQFARLSNCFTSVIPVSRKFWIILSWYTLASGVAHHPLATVALR